MKKHFITIALFLLINIFTYAQDLIILKSGDVIEAKILEIYPTEIRYKRFNNIEGPIYVVPAVEVLSIRYENGIVEVINSGSETEQEIIEEPSQPYAIDPNKWVFGMNIDPVGAAYNGAKLTFEWTKNKLNLQLNLLTPAFKAASFKKDTQMWGGIGVGINYYKPGRIGGFYVGGMVEYSVGTIKNMFRNKWYDEDEKKWKNTGYDPMVPWDNHWGNPHYGPPIKDDYKKDNVTVFSIAVALNTGYKFILKSGMYFRTGITGGTSFDIAEGRDLDITPVIRPDLAIGYSF